MIIVCKRGYAEQVYDDIPISRKTNIVNLMTYKRMIDSEATLAFDLLCGLLGKDNISLQDRMFGLIQKFYQFDKNCVMIIDHISDDFDCDLYNFLVGMNFEMDYSNQFDFKELNNIIDIVLYKRD